MELVTKTHFCEIEPCLVIVIELSIIIKLEAKQNYLYCSVIVVSHFSYIPNLICKEININ